MATTIEVDAVDSNPEIAEESRSRWYVLLLLTLGYLVYSLDKVIVAILIEPIKLEFGLSDTEISVLAGMAMTVPFALTCIPLGMLADRVNRKRLLVVLMLAWSLLTGMAGLATTVALLYVSRIGVGALESGFSPISLSMISDSFSKMSRATAMGFFAFGAPLGVFLSMAVGGYVAGEYGWRAAFFIAGLPGALLALLIAFTVQEPKRGRFDAPGLYVAGSDGTSHSLQLPAVLRNIWRDRALLFVLLGMVFCAVAPAAISVWTPSFLIRVHGMDIKQAGLAASLVVGVCGALGAASGGYIGDHLGRKKEWRKLMSPVFGMVAGLLCLVLAFAVFDTVKLALVSLATAGFFLQFLMGTGYSVATGLCPPSMRTTTLSILLVLFNLGSYGLGTLIFGLVSDALEDSHGAMAITYGMLSSIAFSVVGVLLLVLAMQVMKTRSESRLS